ncbi:MAG TPA: 16S rRNA (cytosine(967)-C(5))-methyltransferase RsmB [Symbiobacteriaceae bacterium]|nr:16S rRNA (cytosine(967)-C(5))-methyltransferase RsmB [Symbiobacteriaceae bacterium]
MPRPDSQPPRSAREAALRALRDVDVKEAYANLALDAHLTRSKLEGRDRALATEIVYGVTRRRGTVDWAIGQVATRPIDQIDPYIRNILRSAVYQVLYMERIPHSAAVDEAVNLARQYGHEGVAKFVNGVLRNFLRRLPTLPWPDPAADPVGALAVQHSHPEWLVRQWSDRFGQEDAVRLMEASNRVPPLTVRVNMLKATREQVAEALAAEGIKTEPTPHSPFGLIIHELTSASYLDKLKPMKAGHFTVQDESSMLVAPVVAPQPGQTVIDAAAAPGGKTTHMAELMENQGRVIAVDVHPHKVELVEQNARRLGATIIEGLCADAREIGQKMPGRADAVLCDAPCSGLGTLARRPDARWRKTPEDVTQLVPIQQAMLESAAVAVKPGGTLVYSTCTIEPRENQELVEAFVREHPDFAFDDIRPYLPLSLAGDARGGWIQLLPHIHGTDGFFIARMKRTS